MEKELFVHDTMALTSLDGIHRLLKGENGYFTCGTFIPVSWTIISITHTPLHSQRYILYDYVISLSREYVHIEKQAIFKESLTSVNGNHESAVRSCDTCVLYVTHTDAKSTTDLFRINITSTSRHDFVSMESHNITARSLSLHQDTYYVEPVHKTGTG